MGHGMPAFFLAEGVGGLLPGDGKDWCLHAGAVVRQIPKVPSFSPKYLLCTQARSLHWRTWEFQAAVTRLLSELHFLSLETF